MWPGPTLCEGRFLADVMQEMHVICYIQSHICSTADVNILFGISKKKFIYNFKTEELFLFVIAYENNYLPVVDKFSFSQDFA